jgi:hypothetical protein
MTFNCNQVQSAGETVIKHLDGAVLVSIISKGYVSDAEWVHVAEESVETKGATDERAIRDLEHPEAAL